MTIRLSRSSNQIKGLAVFGGYLSVEMSSGLVIRDCRLFEKNGRRWIGLPSRQYQRADGTPAYAQIVEFNSRQAQDRFQREALEAVARFEREEGGHGGR